MFTTLFHPNHRSYALIFITVKSAMQTMGANSTATADEYALAKKLALIVASDFMCWVKLFILCFPSFVFFAVMKECVSQETYFNLTVFTKTNAKLHRCRSYWLVSRRWAGRASHRKCRPGSQCLYFRLTRPSTPSSTPSPPSTAAGACIKYFIE